MSGMSALERVEAACRLFIPSGTADIPSYAFGICDAVRLARLYPEWAERLNKLLDGEEDTEELRVCAEVLLRAFPEEES